MSSRKEYLLQKYGTTGDDEVYDMEYTVRKKKKKKKKKKNKKRPTVLVETDTIGFLDERVEQKDVTALFEQPKPQIEKEEIPSTATDKGSVYSYVPKIDDGSGWKVIKKEASPVDSSDEEPPQRKRQRHDSDSEDEGRMQNTHTAEDDDSDSDADDVPRRRHDSDSSEDEKENKRLLPMKMNIEGEEDDSDVDVPRQNTRPDSDSDVEVPRRGTRNDSDSDVEVPRRRHQIKKNDSDSDQDISRRGKLEDSDSDQEVARREEDGDDDSDQEVSRKRKRKDSREQSQTKHIPKPGETIFRDKDGKIIKKKKTTQEEEDELYNMPWGSGLKQKADQEKGLRDAVMSKFEGIARYADDYDMNEWLRDRAQPGDPMAELVSEKKQKKKKKKKKKKEKERPMYKGASFFNRFGILPGYRWDGIDRSNGWEKLKDKRTAEKSVRKTLDYTSERLNW